MRMVNPIAAVVLLAASGIAGGQGSGAAMHPAGLRERRSFAKASACATVASWIDGVLRSRGASHGLNSSLATTPREIELDNVPPGELDCGAMPRLAPGISLDLAKIFYDRPLHSWEFLVRCAAPADCVPFLVRWPRPAGAEQRQEGLAQLSSYASRDNPSPRQHVLLRPGETATLIWDQDGIRVVLPVICLDRGNIGDSIRVRIKSGSRVLRAQIVNESLLRAIL
jgi:flagellar basal body P-ring formation chaperone FlgA